MIEYTIALILAVLGISFQNMRCIHRIEKKLLRFMYEERKEVDDLKDK